MFQSFFELFFLASFTFCLSSILFQNLTRFLSHYTFFALYFFNLLLFNFQWPIRCLQNIQLRYYITNCMRLSSTFFKFSKLFSYHLTLAFATLLYYHICSLLSIPFFKVFSLFLKYFLKSIKCDCQWIFAVDFKVKRRRYSHIKQGKSLPYGIIEMQFVASQKDGFVPTHNH